MDLSTVTNFLDNIKASYKNYQVDSYARKGLVRIEQGNKAIEDMQPYLSTLKDTVSQGRDAVKGALVIASKRTTSSEEAFALEHLTKAYYANGNFAKRTLRRMFGGQLSLHDALEVTRNVALKLPEYVSTFSEQLNMTENDLHQLRADMRDDIETLLATRQPLEDNITKLEEVITTLGAEYDTLEKKFDENAAAGVSTPAEERLRLTQLELKVSEAREIYNDLKTKRMMVESNVDLIRSQITRVGDQIDSVSRSRVVVTAAKEFVNVQVPYLEQTIKATQNRVRAMAGVNETMEFLRDLSDAQDKLNDKVDMAMHFLGDKVTSIRNQIATSAPKQLTSYSERKTKELTQ